MICAENWNNLMMDCMVRENCVLVLANYGDSSGGVSVTAGQYLDPVNDAATISSLPSNVMVSNPWTPVPRVLVGNPCTPVPRVLVRSPCTPVPQVLVGNPCTPGFLKPCTLKGVLCSKEQPTFTQYSTATGNQACARPLDPLNPLPHPGSLNPPPSPWIH